MVNIRKEKELTQELAAKECGIARTTYAMYEQGERTPSPSNAKLIGAAMGFNWTLFFEEEIHETCK
nr:helix-turn-helix transcriptional regulator [Listeria rustica]